MKRLSSICLPLGICAAAAIALAPGCTTHGEGGRCNPNYTNASGGYADCDSTNANGVQLVCTSGALLSLPEGGTVQDNVCCPIDRSKATTDICRGNPVSPGSDAGIPDGGFPDTGTGDAPSDQSTSDVVTDAPSDVATDAPSDAPSDAAGD